MNIVIAMPMLTISRHTAEHRFMHLMLKSWSFFVAGALSLSLIPYCSSPVFAGRPLVVDDARPVGAGFWEFECGLALSRRQEGARELDLPVMALTYGVVKGLDFGINIQRINSDARGEPPIQGFQDFHVATKYNFIEEATFPAMSFVLDLKLPTANRRKGLTSGRVDESFLLIATKHYFPLAIDLNLGYSVVNSPPEEKLKSRLFSGLALRYGLSERWRLVGDVFGLSRETIGGKNEANFQVGSRFRPDLPVFFDVAIGRSLRPSGSRIQRTLGMTWSNSLRF